MHKSDAIIAEFYDKFEEHIEMSGDFAPHLMMQVLACEIARQREVIESLKLKASHVS